MVLIYRPGRLIRFLATHFGALRTLIRIKVARSRAGLNFLCDLGLTHGGPSMPTETALVVAARVAAFAAFAIGLGWASFYTRNVRTPGASE